MRAAVFQGRRIVRLEERPVPGGEPGWGLVKVRAAGICGSDLHFFTGELAEVFDSVRGHEIAGEIVDPADSGMTVGQAVVVHPVVACGECPACRCGELQICSSIRFIGGDYSGGFAEYVAAPARNLYPFDASILPFEHAALADCVAVAVHAMNKVGLSPGESVAVLGDGVIGLLMLQVALARGANPVVLVGKHERNLEVARQLGASLVIDGVTGDAVPIVRDTLGEIDVVLEAVGGASPPVDAGFKMLRKGGRLAMLGLTGATKLEASWLAFVLFELSLTGVMGYGVYEGEDEMQQAIKLMQSGQVALDPLITHRISLGQISQGFEMMLERARSQAIKVVVVPGY